ncbi:MAG TPA: DUF4412 domain-containing protein [Tenuifilaceae bacterium]|nr:DUF4412 domain-containing protein [Tenuifilaceae bacterium]HPE18891.1 DUF4412 domain-containing protein [Tenuifilaceae bacterium]HPJ45112.1 DUF4412 domain-containing protein [Tenuifilaceae bacterium]HPQ33712.1 DUF4412 domain-containing protein [Tenuifilaceae bacterium]HRX68067.1 DUF4412 domain-containing protein [Tenuifilaceae bacterium]
MGKLLLSLFLLLNYFICLSADGTKAFEGRINFLRETVYDTTYITIMVKGSMARIDEFDTQKRLLSSQLVDFEKEKIIALSPSKKLYTSIPVLNSKVVSNNNYVIKKTQNFKEINGYKCYQWRVRDPQHNTEAAYWVINENFAFFDKLVALINRTERSFALYNLIPENEGYFPILTEERTLLRKEKLRIAVVDINEQNLHPSLFEVPRGYNPLRN